MQESNIHTSNLSASQVPATFVGQLRKIVAKKVARNFEFEENVLKSNPSVVFQPDLEVNEQSYQWDALELVRRARNSTLRLLYLRGTGAGFQQEAIDKGVISTKTVDDPHEDDNWSIACYKIPTGGTNISNEEFLFRFFITVLSSTKYAFSHSLFNWVSLMLFSPKEAAGWQQAEMHLWIKGRAPVYGFESQSYIPFKTSDLEGITIFKENRCEPIKNEVEAHDIFHINVDPEYINTLRQRVETEGEELESLWITWTSKFDKVRYLIAEEATYSMLSNMPTRFSGHKKEFLRQYQKMHRK